MPITNYGSLQVVNTSNSGSQYQATAAGLATGKILVTWYDDALKTIRGQYFDAHGNRIGGEFAPFLASPGSAGTELPRISANADGGFTLACVSVRAADRSVLTTGFNTYGADGSFISGTAYTVGRQYFALAKQFGAGTKWVFTDSSNAGDIVVYTNSSTPTTINVSTAGIQICPDLAVLSASSYVVSWWDDANKQIKFRIYNASNVAQTGEIVVGSVGIASQSESFGYRGQAITALRGGGFVVAWHSVAASASDTSSYGIQAAIYTATGVLVKGTFQVNTTTSSDQRLPAIVGTLDGGFAVAWSDFSVSGQSRAVLRTFDASGNATSAEYYVDGAGHLDYQPQLTLLADGRIAVTWEADNSVPQDTIGYHVEMQIVDPRSAAVNLTAVAAGSDFVGTGFGDSFTSVAGNDSFDGGLGVDTAVFAGTRAQSMITRNANGSFTVSSGAGGTDTVTSVEKLKFSDQTVVVNRAYDFNLDFRSDTVFQNVNTGACYLWALDGTTIGLNGYTGWTPGPTWKEKGTGDFNGDGKADILLQNSVDGQCYIWEFNGTALIGAATGPWTPGAAWQARAVGDFNGDGRSDIMLQNADSGQCFVWEMDGTTLLASGNVGTPVGPDWRVKASGDFNGDGKSDLVFQNVNDGSCYIWMLDGTTVGANGYGPWTPGANWQVRGTADFNGDGKSDILIQNANDGQCFIWEMDGTSLIGGGYPGWTPGPEWEARGLGDYNGDGKSDIMLQNSTSGQCYLWQLDGANLIGSGPVGTAVGADWVVKV